MALAYSTALRNAQADAITTAVGSGGLIRIYDGTRPASGGAATTLLAELTVAGAFAGAAVAGVLTVNAVTNDSSTNAIRHRHVVSCHHVRWHVRHRRQRVHGGV